MTIGRRWFTKHLTCLTSAGVLLAAGSVYAQAPTYRSAPRTAAARVAYEEPEFDVSPEMPADRPAEAMRAGSRNAPVLRDEVFEPETKFSGRASTTVRTQPMHNQPHAAPSSVVRASGPQGPRMAPPAQMRGMSQTHNAPSNSRQYPTRRASMQMTEPMVPPNQPTPAPPPVYGGGVTGPRSYSSAGPARAGSARMGHHMGPTHQKGEIIYEGEGEFDPGIAEGVSGGCHDGSCSTGSCSPGGCAPGGCGICIGFCHCNFLDNAQVSVGVQSFQTPLDLGVNGNFGVNESINFGFGLIESMGIGLQVGGRAVQSNFEESATSPNRDQQFATVGLFHRAFCGEGLQYGVVYDYMHDDYIEDLEFSQIRGQVGYLWHACKEIGFFFTSGVDGETVPTGSTVGPAAVDINSHDIYAAYFKHYLCDGGEIRVWGGATSDSDGVVGADFRLPVSEKWALQSNFTYLMPSESETAVIDESWNVGIALVWYPGQSARHQNERPYRPMFDVADNGSFLLNRE